MAPDEIHGPENLRFLLLQLPQHPNGAADMLHIELGLVPANHIKHLVFSGADLEMVQDLVSTD